MENENLNNTLENEEKKKQQIETLKEINRLNKEIRQEQKKRILIIISVIVILFLIIKIFFGTIEINSIFGYPSNKARFYKATINGELTDSQHNLKHTIPLIPFLVNFNSHYLGNSYANIELENGNYDIKDLEKVIIDIEIFKCLSKNNYQVECQNINQKMEKVEDEKYKEMVITRTSNPYEVVYSGKFVNDITDYVKNKGVYAVQIYTKRTLIETEVYFYIKR